MGMQVYVGLSGGVDSGVSAALLQEAGHDVTGVFVRIWRPEFLECTWQEDRLDAMRIAARLDIPFKEIDLSDAYERDVVRPMIAGYARGITPNPDVLCNEKIKFGPLLSWALADGAQMLATGHYAQRIDTHHESLLARGVDTAKDQSYFLHRINQQELRSVLFPVGGMHKRNVRAHAERFGLPVAHKRDSQGLCFVGAVTMADFLRRYIPVEPGAVLDETGARIGEHEGAALYTIGQRHGFVVNMPPTGAPRYVVDIDTESNTITVAADPSHADRQQVTLERIHWIAGAPARDTALLADVRYHATPAPCTVNLHASSATFEQPVRVSRGQSIVFYEGNTCLGGGSVA